MSDTALKLLARQLTQNAEPALWIADESNATILETLAHHSAPITVLTNRFDIAQQARTIGLTCEFSDFDFSAAATTRPNRAFYRISKEKPVVNHVINSLYKALPIGGELWLSGQKNEGVKTIHSQAAKLFGCPSTLKKTGNDYIGKLQKTVPDNVLLDDQRYPELRWIQPAGDEGFFSKPGTYGWNKIDKGSAFLIAQLNKVQNTINGRSLRVLDLGCGYGYLTIQARQFGFASMAGTDNNAAAIRCAAANMEHYGIDAQISPGDCGDTLSGPYDLILCNPPFHQGFTVESSLTEKFLTAAQRLLAAGGQALFVVNAFIPLEAKAARQCPNLSVRMLANNGQFKVIQLVAG